MTRIVVSLLLLFFHLPLFAFETREFIEAKAAGRGGTTVAFAEPEEALFYNPALLGQTKDKQLQIPAGGTLGGETLSLISAAGTRYTNRESLRSLLSSLVGKRASLHFEFFPSYTVPNFAVAGFYQAKIHAELQNPVIPEVNVLAFQDIGAKTGRAWKFWEESLALGISPVVSYRIGGERIYDLDEVAGAAALSLPSGSLVVSDIDLGGVLHFNLPWDFELKLGSTLQRLFGNTLYIVIQENQEGETASLRLPRTLHLGGSLQSASWKKHRFGLAVDLRDLFQLTTGPYAPSLSRHFYAGLEAKLFYSVLHLRLGLFQGYPAGGFGIVLGPVHFDAALFSKERGIFPFYKPEFQGSALISANWTL